MDGPLGKLLPPKGATDDVILDAFMAYVEGAGLSLYPAQEEAILELYAGKNVVLSTPTGSGKSLVALALHFRALARGEVAFYTSPIKALASEKFFDLARALSPDWVGMVTGDGAVNRDASIVCCTAEILANIGLAEGAAADLHAVVMDEFHFYADRERGVAWQIPLLTLPQAQFLLMSATLGEADVFAEHLSKLTDRPSVVVRGTERPVPLQFHYSESPLQESIQTLNREGKAPIYLVNFSQRGAAEEAQNLMSLDLATKDEKRKIAEHMAGVKFTSPYGKELSRFLRHGLGLHHAGLLPKYRLLVERLAQEGLLKVISGTDTLGVGVNVPIRTVLFTKLCKFDGERTALLTARDFHQIAGRAGRRGFDTLGTVVAQAPEHVIENQRLESKANSATGAKKKFVKRKPPERGYVPWDRKTFEALQVKGPEALTSRFTVSYSMVIETLLREGGGCLALGRLIRASHERKVDKRRHGKAAQEMVIALLDAGVLERNGVRFALKAGFSRDFSMHHAMSLWLLEALEQVFAESQVYALDALSLVESILEDPDLLLQKQTDKLKTERMAELKRAGVEYDERIAELEKVTYPKPLGEFIYGHFNAFAVRYPWAKVLGVKPKGIAREIVESFYSFNDAVREYALERCEGLLLRYLADVYRTLNSLFPVDKFTPELEEVRTFLAAIVRQADSSLLDEWERLRAASGAGPSALPAAAEAQQSVVDRVGEFRVLVRNRIFALVRCIARRDYFGLTDLLASPDDAAVLLDAERAWSTQEWETACRAAEAEVGEVFATAPARATELFEYVRDENRINGRQVLLDAEDTRSFAIAYVVDLAASREQERVVLRHVQLASTAER
jgi:superfamily II RNA helicase